MENHNIISYGSHYLGSRVLSVIIKNIINLPTRKCFLISKCIRILLQKYFQYAHCLTHQQIFSLVHTNTFPLVNYQQIYLPLKCKLALQLLLWNYLINILSYYFICIIYLCNFILLFYLCILFILLFYFILFIYLCNIDRVVFFY